MNEHQRFLELAAASIDFRLTPDEQHALRTHLAELRQLQPDRARLAR